MPAGLIYDDAGERMTPSHANKKGARYRYYVSQKLVKGSRCHAPRGRRVPAGDLESLVEERLRQFLRNGAEIFGAIEAQVADVNERTDLVGRAAKLGRDWPGLVPVTKRQILLNLVDRIDLMRETLEIRILPSRLPAVLCGEEDPENVKQAALVDGPSITFTVPARLKRAGMETRLLIDGAGPRSKPDHSLLRLLGQAYRYREMVMSSRGRTMAELAVQASVGSSYFTRILRLSFLAPDIVKTILRNSHPIELTAKMLASDTRLPIAWEKQRSLLGTG